MKYILFLFFNLFSLKLFCQNNCLENYMLKNHFLMKKKNIKPGISDLQKFNLTFKDLNDSCSTIGFNVNFLLKKESKINLEGASIFLLQSISDDNTSFRRKRTVSVADSLGYFTISCHSVKENFIAFYYPGFEIKILNLKDFCNCIDNSRPISK